MDFVKFWPRRRQVITSPLLAAACLVTHAVLAQPAADDPAGVQYPAEVRVPAAVQDPAAVAASGLYDHFIADVDDLSARFVQRRYDVNGDLIEVSEGRFALLRPSRFRWHYATPFEQIIIADGEWLWMYDVELEQASRAPLSDLAETPAMLLSGERGLEEGYRVTELPSDQLRWVGLAPLDERATEFLSARIGFNDAGVPISFELIDGLRELTRIDFADLEINAGLTAADFGFSPPAGVAVTGAEN